MRIEITHRTHYTYAPAASRIALRLRLFPSTFEGQHTISWTVTINDTSVEPLFTDGFGDQLGLWHFREPCAAVEITAAGVVETSDKSGVVAGLPRRPPAGVFLRATPLTHAGDGVRDLASSITDSNELDRMHALSSAVAKAVDYRKGVTTTQTPAADVIDRGAGVCQDFAHVFLSAARHLGTPARYVSGYMLAGDDQDALFETHAWTEVFVKGLGWVGFDPSNNICPTERYVRLSCGLDADFAAPIRGAVSGDSEVELDAHVEIGQAQQ